MIKNRTLDFYSDLRARDFRKKYGLEDVTKAIDFEELLARMGIVLFLRPMSEDLSGGLFRIDETSLILANTDKTKGHVNFTISHELYHYEYDKNLSNVLCNIEPNQKGHLEQNEKNANFFARSLVMPRKGISAFLEEFVKTNDRYISIDLVLALEQQYQVSHAAMCWRLYNLNFIAKENLEDLLARQVKVEATRLGLDCGLYEASGETRISETYVNKMIKAYRKGLYTEGRIKEVLRDIQIEWDDFIERVKKDEQ